MGKLGPLKLSEFSIKNTIEQLDFLSDSIKVACEDIVADIVSEGHKLAVEYDNLTPISGNGDYNFIPNIEGNKGYIAMEGPDSVYVEFGTGDVGADNPHPLHSNVEGINPYNSGPTIRMDHMGNHYWVYPPLANASRYYQSGGLTHGIPAGCQMYNTLIDLKEIAPNIAKKHLEDAIRRYR